MVDRQIEGEKVSYEIPGERCWGERDLEIYCKEKASIYFQLLKWPLGYTISELCEKVILFLSTANYLQTLPVDCSVRRGE